MYHNTLIPKGYLQQAKPEKAIGFSLGIISGNGSYFLPYANDSLNGCIAVVICKRTS